MKYTVCVYEDHVTSVAISMLVNEVNEMTALGWTPLGGISITSTINGKCRVVQALVKE